MKVKKTRKNFIYASRKFGNHHTDSQGIDFRSAKLSEYPRRQI